MPTTTIPNRVFRRVLLNLNELGGVHADGKLPRPTRASTIKWTGDMVRRLGFVQVDSISAVERAQHHILFSRNPLFVPGDLKSTLEERRSLFEHWTHDAAILPVSVYPYWKHCFARQKKYEIHPGYERYFAPVTRKAQTDVLRRIESEGPLKPRDFRSEKIDWGIKGIPTPSLAKITLEYLWRVGKLAVSRRDKREKIYDLSERVIPPEFLGQEVPRAEFIDWACREALQRLGAGTSSQIAHFYDAILTNEAAAWCDRNIGNGLCEIRVKHADGSTSASLFALKSLIEKIQDMPAPPSRLRLINPFDPLIHDRKRTLRIFGFDYAIEIWVPPKKRKYGYYVLPIFEGTRFTGRIDTKVDRKQGKLTVLGLWWEAGVKETKSRSDQLARELRKLAVFAGADKVVYKNGYCKA